MLTILDQPARLCDGLNRRQLLRVGGLSALGLSLPTLLQARPSTRPSGGTFGRAKIVIFLWLQGGPPQHETLDPKPDAPAEIRGEFKPCWRSRCAARTPAGTRFRFSPVGEPPRRSINGTFS
jgi:hypothetical protein